MKTIEELIEEEQHFLPDQAPLEFFVHHNTLHNLEDMAFEKAVEYMAERFNKSAYMDIDYYRDQFKQGRIRPDLIDEEIRNFLTVNDETHVKFLKYLLMEAELSSDIGQYQYIVKGFPDEARKKFQNLFSKTKISTSKVRSFFKRPHKDQLNRSDELVVTFLSAYMDQGVSYWRFPETDYKDSLVSFKNFLNSAGFSSIVNSSFDNKLSEYRSDPFGTLKKLASPNVETKIKEIFRRLPGWAGMVSKLEREPNLATRRSPGISLNEYLFIHLFLDHEFPPNEDIEILSSDDMQFFVTLQCFQYLRSLQTPVDEIGLLNFLGSTALWELQRILHLAFERTYMDKILSGLCSRGPEKNSAKVKFQAFFCLDDREESIRRHLEERSHFSIETFGVAGFFGLDMVFQSHKAVRPRKLCPPAVTPSIVIKEASRDDKKKAKRLPDFAHYGQRTLFRSTLMTFFKGPLQLIGLKKKILFGPSSTIKIEPKTDLNLTYSLSDKAKRVSSILIGAGLVKDFAPLVFMIGHGSNSMNNPHLSAYRCGACAGGNGAPNARAFAIMANDEAVRKVLRDEHGMDIPSSTYFVGGFHDTCSDDITFSDVDLIPNAFKNGFNEFTLYCKDSLELNAHERLRRLKLLSLEMTPAESKRQAEHRANQPGESRPELGHATNSLSFVGRRNFTKNFFLDRRAFLTSYDPTIDEDGRILESLLRAVIPVCAGISLEYYFSKVDNERYGCGTKTPHNVTSLLGVINGSIGDLRTGLVWQMVEYHEPLRNLFIIETSKEIFAKILKDNPSINRVIRNRWVYVAIKDIHTNNYFFYEDGEFYPYISLPIDFPRAKTSTELYVGKRGQIDFGLITN